MNFAFMRRRRPGAAVVVTVALTIGCGGSAYVSADNDAGSSSYADRDAPSGGGSSSSSSGGSGSGSTSGGLDVATDGSIDGSTQESATELDAMLKEAGTNIADAAAESNLDAATYTDTSADSFSPEAGAASDAGVSSGNPGEDSATTPPSDASISDVTVTVDAADAGTFVEESGESGSDSEAMSSACGTTGLPCCPGEQCVDTDLWCISGVCSPCGSSGQPCCGVDCNADNACISTSERSECMPCGGPGQVCCSSLPECQNAGAGYGCYSWGLLENCLNVAAAVSVGATGEPGEECSSMCDDSVDTCFLSTTFSSMHTVGAVPFCVTCGDLDMPCCNGTTCDAGLSCGVAGYCE